MVLIVLCVVLAVAVLVLAALHRTARKRLAESAARDARRSDELEAVRTEALDAAGRADEADRERDDALERVQRARRDAAEVANRLSDATTRVTELEATTQDLATIERELNARIVELDAELSAARATARAVTTDSDVDGVRTVPSSVDPDLLWALTLARIDRRWSVSVAAGVDASSPLLSSTSLLRDAIAIEVDAAREDAGAIIEFTFAGDDVEPGVAATVVALVEELVAGVGQLADEADLDVTVDADAVLVSLSAVADGSPVEIPGPTDLLDADGRYRITRA